MYLDFAELQASSHEVALKLAEKEYDKFRVIQDRNFESDFDKEVKKITGKPKKKN